MHDKGRYHAQMIYHEKVDLRIKLVQLMEAKERRQKEL